MSKLDTKVINEKLEEVFKKRVSAAKIDFALCFVLHDVETGENRFYYELENNPLFEKSISLCTKSDLITTMGTIEKFDFVEQCTQDRQNTKWRFELITIVPNFAALPKKHPNWMSGICPAWPFTTTYSSKLSFIGQILTAIQRSRFFRALTLCLHVHSNLDAHASQLVAVFLSKSGYDMKTFLYLFVWHSEIRICWRKSQVSSWKF